MRPLSADTDELFRQYDSSRELALRNELVARHLYIARAVARRYSGRGIDDEDLFQVSSLALIQAIERFDRNMGVRFATYAAPSVLGAVKNYFRDHLRGVRMPRKSSERLRRIETAREEIQSALMRTPTPEQIANHLGEPLEDVLEALEAGERLSFASLDARAGEEGEGDLLGTLGSADPGFDRVDLLEFLEKEMEKLTKAERFVVTERYWKRRSQRDIARDLGVSQMYVSRVERGILSNFRKSIFS